MRLCTGVQILAGFAEAGAGAPVAMLCPATDAAECLYRRAHAGEAQGKVAP